MFVPFGRSLEDNRKAPARWISTSQEWNSIGMLMPTGLSALPIELPSTRGSQGGSRTRNALIHDGNRNSSGPSSSTKRA